MRQAVNSTFLLCAVTCCPYAAAAPRITLTLAPEIRSENVSIHYYRFGTFGAAGAPATPVPKVHSYDLDPYYEGTLATSIKAVVTAPGCQFEAFDIPVIGESPIEEHFECSALPMASLVGNIAPSRLTRGRNLEVVITYLAFWECGFFQLVDCMVPQVQLARVPLKEDGSFEATITDFSADRHTSESAGSAELDLLLRDAKRWSHIGIGLSPTKEFRTTSIVGLAIKPFYPTPMEFEIAEQGVSSTAGTPTH
jgi:hypothetical protein